MKRYRPVVIVVAAGSLLAAAGRVLAQDSSVVDRVRGLYESAAYEESIKVVDTQVDRSGIAPQEWRPSRTEAEMKLAAAAPNKVARTGQLDLIVGPDGRVREANIVQPTDPAYDRLLIRPVPKWRFEPARMDGVAVAYRRSLDIKLVQE